MPSPRSILSACAIAVIAFSASLASGDSAEVEALYKRGLDDMLAGRYETGCPALAESHRLDPRPGRLFTLAECEAKRGRIATAVTLYGDYLALFERLPEPQQLKQHGREKIAAAQRAELGPQVPELTLVLPPGAPAATVVQRDGKKLKAAALGVPTPIDPGEHVITTQAPGGARKEARIRIERGEKKTVTLEIDAASQVSQPAPGARLGEAPASAAAVTAEEPAAEGGSGRKVAAFVIGGVGVAGLALGGVMGGLALSKAGVAEERCTDADGGSTALCDAEGKDAGDTAKTLGLVSTIGFGLGAAGVVTAAVLLLTTPPAKAASESGRRGQRRGVEVMVDAGRGGVTAGLRGVW